MKAFRVAAYSVAVILAGLAALFAYSNGLVGPTLLMGLPVMTVVTGGVHLLTWWRRRRRTDRIGSPPRTAWSRIHRGVRVPAWVALGAAAQLSLPRFAVTGGEYAAASVTTWVSVLVLLALTWFGAQRSSRLVTGAVGLAGIFCAAQLVLLETPRTGEVALAPPLSGQWRVLSGGPSVLVNHHYPLTQQRWALDLGQPVDASERGGLTQPEDFPAFGQPVLAPAAGTVALVLDDLPDQPLGSRDAEHPAGNYLVVRIAAERYVLMAHLRSGSVRVARGDSVSVGQPLAEVGNSGNSFEPHLHLQVQTGPELYALGGRGWADIDSLPLEFPTTASGPPDRAPVTGDLLTFE